jgi:hypothetical protein
VSVSSIPDFSTIDDSLNQSIGHDFQLPLATRAQLAYWPLDPLPNLSDQPTSSRASFSSSDSSSPEQVAMSNSDLIRHVPRSLSSSPGRPDAALTLINNWFDQVCPAWSAFDSSMNLNRKLAEELWHSSASVFNALQSMSASFLSARLHQMRSPALNLLRTATVCIQAEVNATAKKTKLDAVPTGLLFSLFCLGTTVCWLDASRLGAPFLREAKRLLRRSSEQFLAPDEEQMKILSFFKKSLVYWEMLVSVVEDMDTRNDSDKTTLGPHQQVVDTAGELSTDILPHPWTGISSLTHRLFARSMRLCRSYRRRITKPTGRAISLSTAMQEIEEAQRLEERLLELEFSSIAHINDTGDCRTPWRHLARVAEAYQLASLLQLYVTFPDLVSLRLPQESDSSREGDVPWDKWIIPLTLRLTRVLEQIPPDSGSRVIQPLLYICASTGLRYNLSSRTELYNPSPQSGECEHLAVSHGGAGNSFDILGYVENVSAGHEASPSSTSMPLVALDIAIARNFVINRLNVLEGTLQPKPIVVAQELVRAIWAAYDEEPPGSTNIHWLDIMEKEDLRSLFG